MLNRRSAQPLWDQLRTDLLQRIESGELAASFPGEIEIARDYAVSRHTVREALRHLRSAGVVEWSRGRPSRARPETISQPLGTMYSLFRELERQGIEQHNTLRFSGTVTDAEAAERLGLAADTELVLIERLRLADAVPLAVDQVWVPAAQGHGLIGVDLTHTALYDAWQATEGVRLNGGREEIRAVVADARTTQDLALDGSQGVLCIERVGMQDGVALEFRRTLVRGDRFTLVAQWDSPTGLQVDITA